jgi:hypothetical protein
MKRVVFAVILAGSFILTGAVGRAAHAQDQFPCTPTANGNGTATCTVTFKDAQQIVPPGVDTGGANPCTGALATLTIIYNGVVHVAVNSNGDWVTGTETGTFDLTPVDATQPSYTGHFTSWFGGSDNRQNSVDHATFTVHGVGSDGSTLTFHDTMHVSVSASGVTVSFDKPMCG